MNWTQVEVITEMEKVNLTGLDDQLDVWSEGKGDIKECLGF